MLCPSLCLPVSRNILDCELTRKRAKRTRGPIKPNQPYYLCSCYLCGKELKGAGKHGVIKNRNNPGFEELVLLIRYFVLNVWGRSFMGEWWTDRGRSLGSIGGGSMSRELSWGC